MKKHYFIIGLVFSWFCSSALASVGNCLDKVIGAVNIKLQTENAEGGKDFYYAFQKARVDVNGKANFKVTFEVSGPGSRSSRNFSAQPSTDEKCDFTLFEYR